MVTVVVDVGASVGQFCQHTLAQQGAIVCLAVDPLLTRFPVAGSQERLLVERCIIADVDEPRDMTLLVPSNPELASVLPWNSKDRLSRSWGARSDVGSEVREISCRASSLRDVLIRHGIHRVDFLKIDAQGLDVEVLLSARDYLPRIKSGVLELAANGDVSLYRDAPFGTLMGALPMLSNLGFEIYRVVPNDPFFNEYNVFFRRPGFDTATLEQEIGLLSNPVMYMEFYAAMVR